MSASLNSTNPIQDSTKKSALLDVFSRFGIDSVRGDGMWILDSKGHRYLDFYGGHAVALLGNVHPRLVSTLENQAKTLFFQSNLFDLEIREQAAQRLIRFGPRGLDRVFFVNSGAEANENALRIAFLATKRERVVAVEGGFHGRTAGSAAITAKHENWYAFPHKPYAVTFVPFNDTDGLVDAMGDDVAAVIVEPVQGVAGARVLSAEFMHTARNVTQKHGSLLILDEVQSGMGRTGYPFAAQAMGVTPDVLTVAKGIAGGFPAGAVLVSEEYACKVKKGELGTTFGGGPLACALIETVIDVIESENLLPRVRRLSARLQKECCVGPVQSVQGMGYLLGFNLLRPAAEVLSELRQAGVLAGGSGNPRIARLIPPLIVEDSHVDILVSALRSL